MSQQSIAIGVREVDSSASVLDVRGDLTAACEPELMAAYASATTPTTKTIVLNFSSLEYMNSGGIGLLVTLLVRARRQHQQVLAYGLSDHYRQIFELTRIDEAIGIHHDEEAALAAAAAG